jgi:hypothetical protein
MHVSSHPYLQEAPWQSVLAWIHLGTHLGMTVQLTGEDRTLMPCWSINVNGTGSATTDGHASILSQAVSIDGNLQSMCEQSLTNQWIFCGHVVPV